MATTTLTDRVGLGQFIIYIILLILSVGVAYGALSVRINALEDKTRRYQDDHELILIVNTKMDQLSQDLKDIKIDLKDLKSRRN